MPQPISADLYNRYRDLVLPLTNATQRYEPGMPHRGLTDAEIAAELGVTEAVAREIRCVAELESVDIACYFEADGWKEARFGGAEPGETGG